MGDLVFKCHYLIHCAFLVQFVLLLGFISICLINEPAFLVLCALICLICWEEDDNQGLKIARNQAYILLAIPDNIDIHPN